VTSDETLPLRRRALFLSVPFVLFVALLALAEGAVRLFLPHVDSLDLLVTNPQQQAAFIENQQVRSFRGDPLLLWALRPNLDRVIWNMTLVSTNRQGLRYPRDLGPKPANGFRILALGDSVTFGFRVPRVLPRAPERVNLAWQPYPALVEAHLREQNPGVPIEVIPLAVPGYTSHQGLAWLRRDIDRYQPDLVTACFGWNDINRRARTDRETITTDRASVALRRALSSSQLVTRLGLAARRLAPKRGHAPTPAMRVPVNEYVENLLEIARLARSRGAAAALIGPVYRDRVAHPPEGDDIAVHRRALREAAQAAGFPYLEIPELTEDHHPANDRLFEEHIHPNQKGHRLMAERLLRFLGEQKLAGGLRIEVAGPGVLAESGQEPGREAAAVGDGDVRLDAGEAPHAGDHRGDGVVSEAEP
jgi:lysophospholipase L1-like esterase